jgi:hypothetical protein
MITASMKRQPNLTILCSGGVSESMLAAPLDAPAGSHLRNGRQPRANREHNSENIIEAEKTEGIVTRYLDIFFVYSHGFLDRLA